MKQSNIVMMALSCLICSIFSCATFPQKEENDTRSNLTAGMVKKEIIKGKTNQAEVLTLFGSPNLVTMNSEGEEVWNYNRMSYSTKTGNDGASLLFFGGSRAMSTATTKSFDLIITFDETDIVKTYSVISASY
jgi:hypothetical protein